MKKTATGYKFLASSLLTSRLKLEASRWRESGFTMIELIAAAAFLATLAVTIIEAFIGIETLNRDARNYIIASELAQQELEILRNTPYNNLTVGTTSFASALAAYPSLLAPNSATYTITQVDPNGLKQADVAITYTTRSKTKNVQLTTLISYLGIDR